MCGGNSMIDDALNIVGGLVGGVEEMITHDKAKKADKRETKAEKDRLEVLRGKRQNNEETDVARKKQTAKRNSKRSQQKSKQENKGRSGTILTDELGESAGDISGTVGGKSLLGI
jgi:hypothetical protein